MNIKFTINRENFINRILIPVSRVSDDKIELKIDEDGFISCLAMQNSAIHKSQVAFYAQTKINIVEKSEDCSFPVMINVADIRVIVNTLNQIVDSDIDVSYDGTAIMYESDALSFRFAVVVADAMPKKTFSIDRIESMPSVMEFDLESEILRKLISITSCMTNYDKLYFTSGPKGVKCIHTDKDVGSSDKVEMIVAESYRGDSISVEDEVIITEDAFKLLSANKFDKALICIKQSCVMMKTSFMDTEMVYIVPKRLR